MVVASDKMVDQRVADVFAPRLEAAFEDHRAALLAFVRRRIDTDLADDVISETFAIAWRKRDELPEEPLPWLFAIARHAISNQLRSAQRRTRLLDRLSAEQPLHGSDPATDLDWRLRLADAFDALNEADREVLMLVAWEGLRPSEGARVLGCSTPAFRVRLHRARRKLERGIENDGDAHRPPIPQVVGKKHAETASTAKEL